MQSICSGEFRCKLSDEFVGTTEIPRRMLKDIARFTQFFEALECERRLIGVKSLRPNSARDKCGKLQPYQIADDQSIGRVSKPVSDNFRGGFLGDQCNNDRRVKVDGHRSSSRIARIMSAARSFNRGNSFAREVISSIKADEGLPCPPDNRGRKSTTGFPWRVIVISSPARALSIKRDNCSFAFARG